MPVIILIDHTVQNEKILPEWPVELNGTDLEKNKIPTVLILKDLFSNSRSKI